MNERNEPKKQSVWQSFQGCTIAAGPYLVSLLIGLAIYRYLLQFQLPAAVTLWAASILAASVCMGLLIWSGGNNERK